MPGVDVIGGYAATALLLAVPALFVLGGLVELVRWRAAVPQFIAWGYPAYWPIVTSVIKVAAGTAALLPPLRLTGLSIGLAVCVAGLVTVLRWRTHQFYVPAIGMTLLTVAAVVVALYRY